MIREEIIVCFVIQLSEKFSWTLRKVFKQPENMLQSNLNFCNTTVVVNHLNYVNKIK